MAGYMAFKGVSLAVDAMKEHVESVQSARKSIEDIRNLQQEVGKERSRLKMGDEDIFSEISSKSSKELEQRIAIADKEIQNAKSESWKKSWQNYSNVVAGVLEERNQLEKEAAIKSVSIYNDIMAAKVDDVSGFSVEDMKKSYDYAKSLQKELKSEMKKAESEGDMFTFFKLEGKEAEVKASINRIGELIREQQEKLLMTSPTVIAKVEDVQFSVDKKALMKNYEKQLVDMKAEMDSLELKHKVDIDAGKSVKELELLTNQYDELNAVVKSVRMEDQAKEDKVFTKLRADAMADLVKRGFDPLNDEMAIYEENLRKMDFVKHLDTDTIQPWIDFELKKRSEQLKLREQTAKELERLEESFALKQIDKLPEDQRLEAKYKHELEQVSKWEREKIEAITGNEKEAQDLRNQIAAAGTTKRLEIQEGFQKQNLNSMAKWNEEQVKETEATQKRILELTSAMYDIDPSYFNKYRSLYEQSLKDQYDATVMSAEERAMAEMVIANKMLEFDKRHNELLLKNRREYVEQYGTIGEAILQGLEDSISKDTTWQKDIIQATTSMVQSMRSIMQDELSGALSGIMKGESVKIEDIFKNMLDRMLSAFIDTIAQMAAQKLTTSLFSGGIDFLTGAAGGGGGLLSSLGGIFGGGEKADGGGMMDAVLSAGGLAKDYVMDAAKGVSQQICPAEDVLAPQIKFLTKELNFFLHWHP